MRYYVAPATTPCIPFRPKQYHILGHAGIRNHRRADGNRAALDAALRRPEAQEAAIRAQRATIDAAIRVYDPARKASRPKVPRGHGVVRLVLGTLRNARAPMTAREIAESVADARGVDTGDRKAMNTMPHNVRNTLSWHNGKGLVREERDGVVLWRVG